MARLQLHQESWQVDVVFLDKDGTIIDFMHTWGYWAEQTLRRYAALLVEEGLEAPTDMLSRLGIREDVKDYDRSGPLAMGTVRQMETILAFTSYQLGMPWSNAVKLSRECMDYADGMTVKEHRVKLLPGVERFLQEAVRAQVPLVIGTADETETAKAHMKWLGIDHYFTDIIGTDQVSRGKPYPDMLELAARRHQFQLTECAMIGDTKGDMIMAQQAGLRVQLGKVPTGGDSIAHATACFDSYERLTISA